MFDAGCIPTAPLGLGFKFVPDRVYRFGPIPAVRFKTLDKATIVRKHYPRAVIRQAGCGLKPSNFIKKFFHG